MKQDSAEPGNVTPVRAGSFERAHCARDTFFSYAAYTPRKYSEELKWPVVYILDPHARGRMPVRKYRELADEYGYILIASNDSRNGQPFEYSRRVFESLRNDARQRWRIDERRQYLMGFSGGARLASLLMREFQDMHGMIGCGAGLAYETSGPPDFVYAGVTGALDFNLAEMRRLQESLESVSAEHVMIEFDGIHEWPPPAVLRTAWDWLEVSAIRRNMIPASEARLNAIVVEHMRLIRDARGRYQTGEVVLIYRRLVRMLNHLYDVREYQETLAEMERLYVVHDFQKLRRQLRREEINRQQFYNSAMSSQSMKWWTLELKKLKNPPKEKPADEYRMMNLRLLQYIGLLAYMSAQRAIQEKNAVLAEQYLTIGRMADPANPGVPYLDACFRMMNDDPGQAMTSLQEAARKGFADLSALEDERLFVPLKKDSAFYAVLRLIQANANSVN